MTTIDGHILGNTQRKILRAILGGKQIDRFWHRRVRYYIIYENPKG